MDLVSSKIMSHQNFRARYQKLWTSKILEVDNCNLYLQKKLPNFTKIIWKFSQFSWWENWKPNQSKQNQTKLDEPNRVEYHNRCGSMFFYLTVLEYLPSLCDIFMVPSRHLLCCRIGGNIRRIDDNIRARTRRDHLPGTLQRMEVKFAPDL